MSLSIDYNRVLTYRYEQFCREFTSPLEGRSGRKGLSGPVVHKRSPPPSTSRVFSIGRNLNGWNKG